MRAGTRDWLQARPGHVRPDRNSGEAVEIAVSTKPASAYRYRVFRMGHYGGAGGREVPLGRKARCAERSSALARLG